MRMRAFITCTLFALATAVCAASSPIYKGTLDIPVGGYVGSYGQTISAYFGTSNGHPFIFLGVMNADNTSVLFGNTTGAHGITRIGSNSEVTCGTIGGEVFYAGNNGGHGFCLDVNGNFGIDGFISVGSGSAASCVGGVRFTNGLMVISGAGAPTCSAPNGSLYLRSDGSAGARTYTSAGGGTWNAIPSPV